MAVIDKFRNITTVFEVFEVPHSESQTFLKEFSLFIQNHLKGRVGLISYNLHFSEADGLIFNYGQWKSGQDYESFLNDSELKKARDHFYSKMIRSSQTKVYYAT